MATVFIQIDKPFYIAGDTVNGCVFLNLFENMAANEILIKFKGWESVKWFEERIVGEQERETIPPHLIYNNVTKHRLRSFDSKWTHRTPKTTQETINSPSTDTSRMESS